MKKIQIMLTIVLAQLLCGCVRDNLPAEESSEKMVRIRLSTESVPEVFSDALTKTVLTDDFNVEWHNGDAVALFVDKEPYKLVNVNADGPHAVFEGEVPESWLSRNFRTVLYPYSAITHNGSNSPIADRDGIGLSRVIIPSVQPLVSGSFARDYNYSVAGFKLSEDKPLCFKNLGGLLCVSLGGNVTVTSITVTAPADITGTSYYEMGPSHTGELAYFAQMGFQSEDYLGGNPAASATVTLTSEEGIVLTETPQSFYAFVMPVKSVGDYTVTVETKQGKTFTETITNARRFTSDQILRLGQFNLLYTFADIDGQTVELDPAGRLSKELLTLSEETPQIAGCPDWLDYDFVDGYIVFTPELNVTGTGRSADVTISQGEASSTITFVQTSVPAFEYRSVEFKCEAGTINIAKTEYLPEGFTAVPANPTEDAWITTATTPSGLTISVAENSVGVPRESKVNIMIGDKVVTDITVKQMNKYEYDSLLGEYEIVFMGANAAVTTPKRITGTFTISVKEAGVSYEAILHSDLDVNSGKGFNYPIELLYNASDTNPLTLVCPQFNGKRVHSSFYSWVRVAKKPSEEKFKLKVSDTEDNSAAIDVLAEGAGYDLILDDSDGTVKLDFVPNAIAQEAAPGGLAGLWFPWRKTEADEGPYVRVKDWVMPLEGQEYIKITKK